MQRRIVGSSSVSSAVDGFSPTNRTYEAFVLSHSRQRTYRYCLHGERIVCRCILNYFLHRTRSKTPRAVVAPAKIQGAIARILSDFCPPTLWLRRGRQITFGAAIDDRITRFRKSPVLSNN